jgi:site-specific DNA-adenine methylase
LTYPGGKSGSGVYQAIINLIPPHQVYIEPFLGGGAILRMKAPAPTNFAIDIDRRALNAISSFSCPGLHLINDDALLFLADFSWTGTEFVYCDPPYPIETRSSKAPMYRFEFLSTKKHRALLSLLLKIPAAVMISSYRSELYTNTLHHWSTSSFSAVTRSGRVATETLWMNYPPPIALHDYRYLGKDFREREKIKRRQHRWKKRLQSLPPLERAALLAAINTQDIPSPDESVLERHPHAL